uniref:Rit1 N-terminal domain-containing protein n=1 Tax=Quercus lobata TaxID=97700 RepID=A0A7N2KWZ3_QUELO
MEEDEGSARKLSIYRAARSIKRRENTVYNALRSIYEDSIFVGEISQLWPDLPLLANLRCGLWYSPKFHSTCYFKSTDGHNNNWSFSTSRLNLHVALLAGQKGGCIIVDSTRRGKRFPDSMSKTIPIWTCVLNRCIHNHLNNMRDTAQMDKDSLRLVFMGKESAIRLLTYVEDLMSNTRPDNFARTFKDGNKVFILQLRFNAHGSFLMISELLHGRRKGLIIVPEGKLGSGWRGFGFHLRKAIAPDTLVVKPPSQSALFPTVQKFRNQKSFLSVVVDGDRKTSGGSGTGKHAMPNIQNSIKSNPSIKSILSSQKT